MRNLNVSITTMAMFNVSFSWYDYVLFFGMLVVSALIGIYFGIIKKQNTSVDYLLGGKEMRPVPVATSLIASSISGITLLAVPADVYKYGVAYWLLSPVMIFVAIVTYYVFLPVFYNLPIKSTNEYFNLRFNSKIQKFASLLYTISNMLYLPIVIYIPALALSQATGINIYLISPVICGVCLFYTTLGGLKAVVWTDAIQFVLMMLAIIAVFFMGVFSAGGFAEIWLKSRESGRLNIDLSLDLTKRETFLSSTIGMLFIWVSYISVNQGYVQKCLSLPAFPDVRNALIMYALGTATIVSICVYTGLIMFARYSNCDPLTTGQVREADQLLPYYVLDVARSVPGLPGLFISGIFSAALSTLSAVMNCMACTIYEDFIAPHFSKNLSEKKVSTVLKWIVVVIGIVNLVLVFVVEHLGGLLALSFSLSGITAGPILGLFCVGMLVPRVDSTGALWGGIVSLVVMIWIVCGQQWYQSQGKILYPTLPLFVNACSEMFNQTESFISERPVLDTDDYVPMLYRISYYWYTVIGGIILVLVSVTISSFTNKNRTTYANKNLFSPVIHFLLPKDIKSTEYKIVAYVNNTDIKITKT